MTKLNPYLFFNGNCEDAFNFYKSVFGKDFRMARYKDVPHSDRQIFHEEDDKIMHVSLPINAETTLMGADITGLYKQHIYIYQLLTLPFTLILIIGKKRIGCLMNFPLEVK